MNSGKTRAGSIELAVPKLRSASYFPDCLLEPRRRAEKALVAVVAEAYVAGVSTRRVDGLVQSMGAIFDYVREFTWRRVICWLRHTHPRANWKWLRRRYLPGW